MNDGVRRYKGREYVSVTEFADRVGCSRMTVHNYIKSGNLQGTHIDRSKDIWLDWEAQSMQWKLRKKTGGRKLASEDTAKEPPATEEKRKRGRPKKNPGYVKISENKLKPPSLPSAPEIESGEDRVPKADELIDLSKINPDDHKDCWIMNGSTPVYNPLTGEPMLDYDKLKLKLVAQKYQLDLDEKRGQLISKEELSRSMLVISRIITTSLDSIPQRYESTLISMAENMSGYSFSVKEKAAITEALKTESLSIARSIAAEIAKLEGMDDEQ